MELLLEQMLTSQGPMGLLLFILWRWSLKELRTMHAEAIGEMRKATTAMQEMTGARAASHDTPAPALPRSTKGKALPALLLAGLLLVTTGCIDRQYAQADRATYEALEPITTWGIENKPGLTPEQRESAHLTVKTWELRSRKGVGK